MKIQDLLIIKNTEDALTKFKIKQSGYTKTRFLFLKYLSNTFKKHIIIKR